MTVQIKRSCYYRKCLKSTPFYSTFLLATDLIENFKLLKCYPVWPSFLTLVIHFIQLIFQEWVALYYLTPLIVANFQEECVARLIDWKASLSDRGLRVNMGKTKFMVSGTGLDVPKDTGRYPCAVCRQGVGAHSIFCGSCKHWVHKRCSGKSGTLKEDPNFVCPSCTGTARDHCRG